MDVSIKALLVSALWTVFWFMISSAMAEGHPVKWKETTYGTFPAAMFFFGLVGIFGSTVWFVVTL